MTRIVRAAQSGPKIVASQVADAHAQARDVLARAHAAADAQLARATAEGRAQGRAELASEWLALTQERDRLHAEAEKRATEIAMLAAERIVGEELTLRPELIANTVRSLLTRVRRAKYVTLRVHPDDAPALKDILQAWTGNAALPAAVHVEDDPQQARGGCLLISDVGTLDARVETQLQALARALGSK